MQLIALYCSNIYSGTALVFALRLPLGVFNKSNDGG